MKKLITVLVAALALVAFTPDFASAGRGHGGKGWRGGHHGWHGGRAWRGHAYRGWRGYGHRGWGYRRYGWGGWGGWGWGGWWGPGISIAIGPGYYGRRCWSPSYGYYPCRYRWGY
jgi:hypothetical protein